MAVVWSFGSFAFFLVPYYLQSIKGAGIYTLSYATEIAEFLASILCIFVTRLINLKKALQLCLLLVAGASCGLLVFFFVRGNTPED